MLFIYNPAPQPLSLPPSTAAPWFLFLSQHLVDPLWVSPFLPRVGRRSLVLVAACRLHPFCTRAPAGTNSCSELSLGFGGSRLQQLVTPGRSRRTGPGGGSAAGVRRQQRCFCGGDACGMGLLPWFHKNSRLRPTGAGCKLKFSPAGNHPAAATASYSETALCQTLVFLASKSRCSRANPCAATGPAGPEGELEKNARISHS